MPFTVSHTAVVLPVALRRGGVIAAALCVGAMVPDVPYFLPIRWGAEWTHHPLGLVIADLPLGVLLTVCWLKWLQQPALSLAPLALRERVRASPSTIDSEALRTICIGVLIGAATHIIWDSFTHREGLVAGQIPSLQQSWLTLAGYPLAGYQVIQHTSTAVGLIAVVWLLRLWVRRTPALPNSEMSPDGLALPRSARALGRLSLLAGLAVFAALHFVVGSDYSRHIQLWLAITGAIQGAIVAALLYAWWWHRRARALTAARTSS